MFTIQAIRVTKDSIDIFAFCSPTITLLSFDSAGGRHDYWTVDAA
jgi:hypothetical protein